MRVYRLRLFGREIGAWEVEGDVLDPVQLVADAIASLADDTEDDTEDDIPDDTSDNTELLGAGSHNFERDLNPRYPEAQKDVDSWIDRPFGFHR